MPEFIPGLQLSERYYWEAIRPILDEHFPGLSHSAGLIGSGSDAMGFDTVRSTDHHWGPRAMLFLGEEDHARLADAVDQALRQNLPVRFLGYSTHFTPPNPQDNGVRLAIEVESGPVNHMVEILTAGGYARGYLGVDPSQEMAPFDWLILEEQHLFTLARGGIFFDGLEQLQPLRRKLAFYPREVWLYLLAAEWQKIGQMEAFPGRTAEVGDDLGSRLVTGQIVHSLMRLAFLMERQFPPYSKWFGTGFSRLACAARLDPALDGALAAASYAERENFLCQAYEICAGMHNALGLTEAVPTQPSFYFGRPFRVIHADRIAALAMDAVTDPGLRRLRPPIGSINQFLDSVDVLDRPEISRKLHCLYEGGPETGD